ncbi:MAG: glycosyltransferase family 4 protein [Actinomycetota bacterium]
MCIDTNSTTNSILFLASSLNIGGLTTYIAKKAQWLVQHGWKATIASPDGLGKRLLKNKCVRHYILPELADSLYLGDLSCAMASLSKLSTIVRQEQVNIIESHAPLSSEHGEALSRILQIPLIVVSLSSAYVTKRYRPWLDTWAAQGRFHAAYYSLIAEIKRAAINIDVSKCQVIRVPIEVTQDLQSTDLTVQGQQVRADLNIPADATIILSVSRLDPDKAYIGPLIEQFTRQVFSRRPLYLVILGDGADKQRLQRLAKRHKRRLANSGKHIVFVKSQVELAPFYRMAQVFVGQGTSALEAANCGLPVVLATIPPLQDVSMGYFGQDTHLSIGEVIPEGVRCTYGELIVQILDNPDCRTAIAEQGRAAVQDHFGVAMVMKRQAEIYKHVIAEWANSRVHSIENCVPWKYYPSTPLEYAQRWVWHRISPSLRFRIANSLRSKSNSSLKVN